MEFDDEIVPGPIEEEDILEALADASSRRILSVCAEEARSVKDISEETGIPLASTYRHVRSLVEGGLLVRSRSAISEDGKRYDLFRSRVHDARMELTPEGIDVHWQLNQDVEERIERLWKEKY